MVAVKITDKAICEVITAGSEARLDLSLARTLAGAGREPTSPGKVQVEARAALRASASIETGDVEDWAEWLEIMEAAEMLLAKRPSKPAEVARNAL